jgi:hypothetical protein
MHECNYVGIIHFGSINIPARLVRLFQVGDGTLIALWSAVFAHRSETNIMWEVCANQIRSAGRHRHEEASLNLSIIIRSDVQK